MSELKLDLYNEIETLKFNFELINTLNLLVDTLYQQRDVCQYDLYQKDLDPQYGKKRVSPESLIEILQEKKQIDVATEDCNLIKYECKDNKNQMVSFIQNEILSFFKNNYLAITSGKIWYPRNGYMGWHTNSNAEGLRLYCSYAHESDKSFFRFFNSKSKEVITSMDKKGWTFRLFKVDKNEPLWHSVYSETHRISLGFRLVKAGPQTEFKEFDEEMRRKEINLPKADINSNITCEIEPKEILSCH